MTCLNFMSYVISQWYISSNRLDFVSDVKIRNSWFFESICYSRDCTTKLGFVLVQYTDVYQLFTQNLAFPCTNASKMYKSQLRSNSKILFKEPRFAKSWGSRSFLCAAPHLWNKLPEYVKTAKSVDSFKTMLKTLIMRSECDFLD